MSFFGAGNQKHKNRTPTVVRVPDSFFYFVGQYVGQHLFTFLTNHKIVIYLSVVSINKALQGAPSAPDKFNGAAFKK